MMTTQAWCGWILQSRVGPDRLYSDSLDVIGRSNLFFVLVTVFCLLAILSFNRQHATQNSNILGVAFTLTCKQSSILFSIFAQLLAELKDLEKPLSQIKISQQGLPPISQRFPPSNHQLARSVRRGTCILPAQTFSGKWKDLIKITGKKMVFLTTLYAFLSPFAPHFTLPFKLPSPSSTLPSLLEFLLCLVAPLLLVQVTRVPI
jgi:hypothetical protein